MLAGLALALAPAALAPAAADPTPPAGRPPFVPCPIVKVAPQPPAVASPVPQPDLSLPTIGGEGLGTKGLAAPQGEPPLPKNLSAPAWIVADLDTGAVVGACGPHERWAPASLEKLLLAATLMPKLDPNQVITVTKEDLDFEQGSSAVGLLLGGKYQVRTLWLGLMLNSGNDAANVLARIGGGPEGVAGTMAAMNAEARRLGAYDTHAETPHGLDGPGQVTSVYDLALDLSHALQPPRLPGVRGTQSAKIPAQPPKDKVGFQIQNDNRLLDNYAGAMGGKTGFTDIARHNFVGAAQRDGRRLVVAILGAEHRPVRTWQQTAALLDWGFSTSRDASVGTLVQPGEAEQLFVRASAAAAAAQPAAGVPAARAPLPSGSVVKVGIVVVAALFATVWLIVLLWSWRRRAASEP